MSWLHLNCLYVNRHFYTYFFELCASAVWNIMRISHLFKQIKKKYYKKIYICDFVSPLARNPPTPLLSVLSIHSLSLTVLYEWNKYIPVYQKKIHLKKKRLANVIVLGKERNIFLLLLHRRKSTLFQHRCLDLYRQVTIFCLN